MCSHHPCTPTLAPAAPAPFLPPLPSPRGCPRPRRPHPDPPPRRLPPRPTLAAWRCRGHAKTLPSSPLADAATMRSRLGNLTRQGPGLQCFLRRIKILGHWRQGLRPVLTKSKIYPGRECSGLQLLDQPRGIGDAKAAPSWQWAACRSRMHNLSSIAVKYCVCVSRPSRMLRPRYQVGFCG